MDIAVITSILVLFVLVFAVYKVYTVSEYLHTHPRNLAHPGVGHFAHGTLPHFEYFRAKHFHNRPFHRR